MPRSLPHPLRTRRARVLLLLVVLLGLGLLLADRLAAALAAGRVAERMRCASTLAGQPEVSFGGGPFLPQLLAGRLSDVRVRSTLDYDRLAGRSGATLGGEDGLVVVRTTARVMGSEVPVTVRAEPRIEGTTLRLVPVTAELLGFRTDASRFAGRIGDRLTRPLPALPDGFAVEGVRAEAEGLTVTLRGRDVALGAAGSDGACRGAR